MLTYENLRIAVSKIQFPTYGNSIGNIRDLYYFLVWIFIKLKDNKSLILNAEEFLGIISKFSPDNHVKLNLNYPKGNKEMIVDIFNEKDLDNKNGSALLPEIFLGQIEELEYILEKGDLEGNPASKWHNFTINRYLDAGISGLIDHFGKNETRFNSMTLCYLLELGKYYE